MNLPSTATGRVSSASTLRRGAQVWSVLRTLKPHGFHFRRQVAMGPFIADFACHSIKLVIEADGAQHDAEVDAGRDARFARAG